jgi:hypothetical protein
MSAHTPGPWAVHPRYEGFVIPAVHADRRVGGAGDPLRDLTEYAQTITRIDPVHRHRDRSEQMANARLIAAAPELLHACLLIAGNAPEVAAWLREYDPGAFKQIQAAIAKATQP